jgi:putative lipoic acid-binding regulatory protein
MEFPTHYSFSVMARQRQKLQEIATQLKQYEAGVTAAFLHKRDKFHVIFNSPI